MEQTIYPLLIEVIPKKLSKDKIGDPLNKKAKI